MSSAGFQETEKVESSRIVIINSCTVTHKADSELRRYINSVLKKTDAVIFVTGCFSTDDTNEDKDKSEEVSDVVQSPLTSTDPAFILRTNCYLCHSPNAKSHENILGPPLVASKFRYYKEYPEREDFIEGMKSFILNPQKEMALMKNPVKKFGVMPNTILSENQVQAVVEYIYDNKVDEPGWFGDHYSEEHGEPWLGQNAFDEMSLKEGEQ